jgi:hypothetical protein
LKGNSGLGINTRESQDAARKGDFEFALELASTSNVRPIVAIPSDLTRIDSWLRGEDVSQRRFLRNLAAADPISLQNFEELRPQVAHESCPVTGQS